MVKTIKATAVLILGCCLTSLGQDFKVGVSFGTFLDVSPLKLGNAGGIEIGYKLKPNFYLNYEYLYANINTKTSSYGNPLADGIGRQKQMFGNGLNVKYFFKQRGNYQTFVGLGALYSQEKFNNKTAISNTTVSEIIGNQNTLGAVPMAGIKYQSQYKIEASAALRGIITSNTQAIQLVFGLALPL
jgi:outer membrane protein W